MPSDDIRSETLRGRLTADHQEIEEFLVRLIDAFDSGDREIATTAFKAFDRRLTAHLAFEDEVLLPEFAAVDPEGAAQIATEHRAIRARVDQLAIADNLHLSRATEIRELVEILRRHAEREEAWLYEWAERAIDSDRMAGGTEPSPASPRT